MIEVLWHGRGGQGAFTAARLLGAAASLSEGRYALAFPSFGPERRGAPMRAFTKMSETPIGDRSAVDRADFVVYLDETLFASSWENELKPGGLVLVNSRKSFNDDRVVAIDADGLSASILGRPIPNTVLLGALSAVSDQVGADEVKEAVRQYMPAKLHEKNIAIVDAARELLAQVNGGASPEGTALDDGAALADTPAGREELPDEPVAPARPAAHIPTLRTGALNHADYARSTCFEAGYLVAKNAGWRNVRPVVDQAACTGCLQCYLYCPDGTVYKAADPVAGDAPVAIDYDFCKGCGICVTMCKFDAITMIPESEADAR